MLPFLDWPIVKTFTQVVSGKPLLIERLVDEQQV